MTQKNLETIKTPETLQVGVLASGEKVYDRPNGHIHETIRGDLPQALLEINAKGQDKIIETVTLEGKTWKSFKVSIDPEKDKEDLFLARRTSRAGLSTFVKNREPGETNQMVVILSKNDGKFGVADGYTVITAFSGDMAPREPWDAYFNGGTTEDEKTKRRQEKEKSLEYWSRHAFIPDDKEFPIDQGTEQAYAPDKLKFPFLTLEEREKQVVYTGLFVVDQQKLFTVFPPKHAKTFAHHLTIEFMPKDIHTVEIGKVQQLKVIGRASDEKGDALLVENVKSKSKYPHITLSCVDGVSASYSNQLIEKAVQDGSVEYFPEPVFIDAIEGYENGNKKVVTEDKFLIGK